MIPEVNPYNNYRGDGVATKFDYDFLIQDGSQLIVQKITEDDVAINLVNNVDYEIKEIGNVNGGYINFPLAGSEHSILTENETISLQLTLPFEQESEYGQSSMLNLGSLEFSLDYLTRLCQILKRQMERSVKANEGNDVIDITLPPPKANNTFVWNEDCSALVNYDIIGENNAFKNEMVEEFQSARDEFNTTIATNKQEILDIQEQFEGETNAAIKEFEDGIDAKIATVADAADRINDLDNDLAAATNAAEQATQEAQNAAQQVQNAKEQAEIAANKADEILNVKDELEAEIGTKANVDLSNLSEVGEKHFLNKSQITNCITEIPQRINLELTDGVLTLKAGSVVTVPNGFEIDGQTPKFDYVTIDSDKQLIVSDPNSTSSSSGWLIFYSTDGYARNSIRTLVFSGNTAPTFNANYAVWYDTASNVIKYTSDKGVTWTTQNTALPLCSLTRTNGTATSVDIIYNSMGCFASTVWIDKGVKALIPNGRNEDGSLKNIEVISTKLTTSTNPFNASDSGCARIFIMEDGLLGIGYRYIESETEPTTTYTTWYNPKTNLMFYKGATTSSWSARFMTPIFSFTYDYDSSTSINTFTNMVPKSPFRAVDYSDKPQISGWAMPSSKYIDLNLGANNTTYTAPANGYFMLSGTTTSTSRAQVALYAEDQGAYGNKCVTTTNSDYIIVCIPIQRGTRAKVSYTDNLTNKLLRFIYAQGEV